MRTLLTQRLQDNEREGFPITAVREIVILSKLDHPNVVKLVEVVVSQPQALNNHAGSVFLVLEYMDHDLAGLAERPGFRLHPAQAKCLVQQLLQGLAYCHNRGVLHRDLKSSNLLLDNHGCLKIADFGLARRTASLANQLNWTNRVITLWYRPPELLLGATHYGLEVDMWSVGCIVAELILSKTLLQGSNEAEQLERIFSVCGSATEENWPGCSRLPFYSMFKPVAPLRRRLREVVGSQPHEVVDLLEGLLTLDPSRRMTAPQALRHAYFRRDPLPCLPSQLPRFEPCHELQMKRRRQEARAAALAEEAEAAARRAAEEAERRKAPQSQPQPQPEQPQQQAPSRGQALPPQPLAPSRSTLGMGYGAASQQAAGWAQQHGGAPYGSTAAVPFFAGTPHPWGGPAYGGWGHHAPPPPPPPPPPDQRFYEQAAAREAHARRQRQQQQQQQQSSQSGAAMRLLRWRPASAPPKYYPLATLLSSPSRADGISESDEAAFRYSYVRFLEDVSKTIAAQAQQSRGGPPGAGLPRPVLSSAAVFAHRFYTQHSHGAHENRLHVVGAAALLLAGKVEGAPRTLQDIACASYRLRVRADLLSDAHKHGYPRERENILEAERRLVRCLGFQFAVPHALDVLVSAGSRFKDLALRLAQQLPHDSPPRQQLTPSGRLAAVPSPAGAQRTMASVVRSASASPVSSDSRGSTPPLRPSPQASLMSAERCGGSSTPARGAFDAMQLRHAAISFANDSHRTLLALQYDAHTLAGGFLVLAARMTGAEAFLNTESIARVLGAPLEQAAVDDVCEQMVASYRHMGQAQIVSRLLGQEEARTSPSPLGKRARETEETLV